MALSRPGGTRTGAWGSGMPRNGRGAKTMETVMTKKIGQPK